MDSLYGRERKDIRRMLTSMRHLSIEKLDLKKKNKIKRKWRRKIGMGEEIRALFPTGDKVD